MVKKHIEKKKKNLYDSTWFILSLSVVLACVAAGPRIL